MSAHNVQQVKLLDGSMRSKAGMMDNIVVYYHMHALLIVTCVSCKLPLVLKEKACATDSKVYVLQIAISVENTCCADSGRL